jgi:hypothetical protein
MIGPRESIDREGTSAARQLSGGRPSSRCDLEEHSSQSAAGGLVAGVRDLLLLLAISLLAPLLQRGPISRRLTQRR